MGAQVERTGMFTTVLVPTDGRQSGAEVAIAHATELGWTYDASVHALYVIDTGTEPAARRRRRERNSTPRPSVADGRRRSESRTELRSAN